MRRGLRAVDQHHRAGGVRLRDHRLDRIDRAERVRDVADGDDLRARRQQPRVFVLIDLAGSLIGTTLITAPVCSATSCHGTMFE